MNLTPWDVQSKQIHTVDDTAPPLYSGECRYGGGETYILIVVEDQGGGVIQWNTKEQTGTLRSQTHGHEPLVVLSTR